MMNRTRTSILASIGAILLGFGCSGDPTRADEAWDEPGLLPSDEAVPVDENNEHDEPALTVDEKQYINFQLAEPGVTIPDSAFVGRTLRMRDAFLDLDPILARRGEKARVLLDNGYITERSGAELAFSRPQTGDEVWLVVPPNLRATFQQAVQDIANASPNDCLNANFVNIKSPQDLAQRRSTEQADFGQVLDLNIMVTQVHADVSRCSGSAAGCADFPSTFSVNTLQPVPAIGFLGESQNVFGLGHNISIDPTDPNLLHVVTHELLHSLGLAHTREEIRLRKALIPGTQDGDDGYPSIMHARQLVDAENNFILDAFNNQIPNPDNSLTITADDADAIATLYAPPCDLGARQTYIIRPQLTCFGGVCQ